MNLRVLTASITAVTFALSFGEPAAEDKPAGKSDKVLKALDRPTAMAFAGTPFRDVVTYLADVHGFPIDVDWEQLAKVDWNQETRVTTELKAFTLREALERLLGDNLRFEVTDKALRITARSPEEIHNARTPAARKEKLQRALEQAMHLDFTKTPLSLVVRQLSNHHNIIVTFDVLQLEKEGWSESTPISFPAEKGIKLRDALVKILGDRLTYVLEGDQLLITSRSAVKK